MKTTDAARSDRDAFERLSPALQYQIVNVLGFRELRPVQLATIEALADGANAVVLAPTAGGKTEAALFPLLSAMDREDWTPVSVLYVSPIRALLNDQEARITRYAALLGRRVFKWHGDTAAGPRRRFLADPADILMITPESLEAMLVSPRIAARRLFRALRAVIIDEVHAFAADDRGAHLSALLQRLARYSGRDVQRVGLSATVGNPEELLRWLHGTSERPARVVDPPRRAAAAELVLDYVGSLENAARVVASLHRGRKRLLFVDSRRRVEQLGELLRGAGVDTHLVHGSLSTAERRDAEQVFHEGKDCVIVATSALELGLDVGDLDHVLQIDAPGSVASFLQRMGRTGRRAGTTPNCTFLATSEDAVLRAAALIALHRRGFVEPVRPSRRAVHILAHQLMALGLQEQGVARSDWWAWIAGATPFLDLGAEDREELVSHMLAHGVLADHDGRLWLGPEGEKLYGRRHFAELYAVFSTPRLVTVRWEAREIGTVDAGFLSALTAAEGPAAFVLAGRPWGIVHTDWRRGVCAVQPAKQGRAARWPGRPGFLGFELCRAMWELLTGEGDDPSWSRRARTVMAGQRAEHAFLREAGPSMTVDESEITWWTFAGGRANLLLARMIEAELGGRSIVRNTSLAWKSEGASRAALSGFPRRGTMEEFPRRGAMEEFLRRLAAAGRPDDDDASSHARGAARGRLSKFEPCLPPRLHESWLAQWTLDVAGARSAVTQLGA